MLFKAFTNAGNFKDLEYLVEEACFEFEADIKNAWKIFCEKVRKMYPEKIRRERKGHGFIAVVVEEGYLFYQYKLKRA